MLSFLLLLLNKISVVENQDRRDPMRLSAIFPPTGIHPGVVITHTRLGHAGSIRSITFTNNCYSEAFVDKSSGHGGDGNTPGGKTPRHPGVHRSSAPA